MAWKLCRHLAMLGALAAAGLVGCKKADKFDGPIASTPITTKKTPEGQPKPMPEPKPDPKRLYSRSWLSKPCLNARQRGRLAPAP